MLASMKAFQAKTKPTKAFVGGDLPAKPFMVMEGGETLPTDYENLEATKECELKQGYLALVTSIVEPTIQNSKGGFEQGPPVITAKSTFAVLNKQSLSFFDKEQVNSLIKNVDITHLKPMVSPTKFGDLTCFQLVAAHSVDKMMITILKQPNYLPLEQCLVTVCAQDSERMTEWASAIKNFHNCNVAVAKDETEVTPTQLDMLSSRRKTLRKRIQQNEMVKKELDEENNSSEVLMVQKQVDNIKTAVMKEKSEQAIAKRAMTVKLENDIKSASEMEVEQECVQKTQQIQEEEEEKEVENMIQNESQTRESIELEAKKAKILEMLKKQGNNIALQENELDTTINKMTKAMQYNMVQSVQNYEKVLDPQMCYLAEYAFPKEAKTKQDKQKYVCTRMIDPTDMDIESINDCLIPAYFCDVCCDYNIGKSNEVGREKCATKCADKLEGGKSNLFTIGFTIEANVEKIENMKIEQKKKKEEERKELLEKAQKDLKDGKEDEK